MRRKEKIAFVAIFLTIQVLVTAYCVWAVIDWGDSPGSGSPDVEWGLQFHGLAGMLGFAMTLLLARWRTQDWLSAAVWGVWADVVAVLALIPVWIAALPIEIAVEHRLDHAAAVRLDKFLTSKTWLEPAIAALVATLCVSMCYWRRKRET